ncbi:MAG: ATP-binding cassette domain-containing protein [Propionibacteriales bacterium]|nr:ATP-binding cassette domain-containing protein [Propionibacteriales bacterium]
MAAIEAHGLTKTFGKGKKQVRALDGLDLEVPDGGVLGLLGPNGAGKTTTVRILATLLTPDEGEARVLGHDAVAEPAVVRGLIGLSGQFSAIDENLTGRENLWMFGRLYGLDSTSAKARGVELLEMFELTDAADRVCKTYSGGMKRRLDLAGSLIAHPKVLFLDEPTTGLDPKARLDLWDIIRDRVESGVTVLLTTQYLEEADVLADSIAVIDHGRVIAEGSSDDLKSQVGGERIELVVHDPTQVTAAHELLTRSAEGEVEVDAHARKLTAPSRGGSSALVQVIRELDLAGVAIDDIGLRRPTLDDVFMSLTGHTVIEEQQVSEPAGRAS